MASTADELERRFNIATTRVAIGSHVLEMAHPSSADDLIDEEDFDRDERLPYWANIWPSSRVLARRLSREPGESRRLLELGCGVGLAALVAGAQGFHVLATDYYGPALEFVETNAARNRVACVETRLIDYRQLPSDLGTFDVVAASDVLYERPYAALVADAISRCLASDGLALVTDPNRQVADPFAEECRERGLVARLAECTSEPDGKTAVTVNLFEIRWESILSASG